MTLINKSNDIVFIFIHGFGTSEKDLSPLAHSFYESGYSCETILLKGHGYSVKEIKNVSFNVWIQQLEEIYNKHISAKKKVFLVGFSLGGALCLEFAKTNQVEGILSISTFLGPAKFRKKILQVLKFIGIKRIPRRIQVTNKVTKNELDYLNALPVESTLNLIKDCNKIIFTAHLVKCPILFLHSLDDKVASYGHVYSFYNMLNVPKKNLITFRGLKHFIQFDLRQDILVKLSESFFIEKETLKDAPPLTEYIEKAWSEALSEEKHWSGILFKLITGYFTIFGTLVYFSLADVLQQTPSAAYYLVSYTIITSLFFVLISLYYFYINRVLIYIKNVLEPLLPASFSWVTYKANEYMSGSESKIFTKQMTISIILAPLVICFASIYYAIKFSFVRVSFDLFGDYYFIWLFILLGIIMFLISLYGLWSLNKYHVRELHHIPRLNKVNNDFMNYLTELYLSIAPGSVRQKL